ncbi:MAG: tRNA (guanosine(37)-N1)-methyltransferase TrmD [Candidatus Paceibacterota bacterium]
MTTFHLISIFPKSFTSYIECSIIARAIKAKKIAVKFYDPRDYTADKHRSVDDRPYGGGPGMVMSAEPIILAARAARWRRPKAKVYLLATTGKQFTNQLAGRLAKKNEDIIIICGRYEGIDARVKKILRAEYLTIGPYVLTGGELPALVVIDAIARQIPGVLGKTESLEESRPAGREVYTRPEVMVIDGKNYRVPKVLLSGDHKKITDWRQKRHR